MAEPSGGTRIGTGNVRRPVDPTAEMGSMWGPAAPPPAAPPPPATPPQAEAPQAPGGTEHRLSFHGSGGTLFGIYVATIFLTLVTFGIYSFWGKTRIRRYMFGQTEIAGDRFAYHGTGKELLIGTLKAGVLFMVPMLLLNVIPMLELGEGVTIGAVLLAYALIGLLIPVAIVGARRYRLSRTSWRGIRFSFRGRALDFMKIFLKGGLLTLLTFGFYYPAFVIHRHAYLVPHSYFGSQRFGFDGRPGQLFGLYVLLWLLWLPTLGLYWFWFEARRQRYMWSHTTFGAARFQSTVTGGALLGLHVVNLLLLLVTLGFALSWVMVRTMRFNFRYLTLVGPVDLDSIAQEAQFSTATGEGLAGWLDTGLDLDA
jgi:uncharacterized membrane protein YjgN (DUF898 family)